MPGACVRVRRVVGVGVGQGVGGGGVQRLCAAPALPAHQPSTHSHQSRAHTRNPPPPPLPPHTINNKFLTANRANRPAHHRDSVDRIFGGLMRSGLYRGSLLPVLSTDLPIREALARIGSLGAAILPSSTRKISQCKVGRGRLGRGAAGWGAADLSRGRAAARAAVATAGGAPRARCCTLSACGALYLLCIPNRPRPCPCWRAPPPLRVDLAATSLCVVLAAPHAAYCSRVLGDCSALHARRPSQPASQHCEAARAPRLTLCRIPLIIFLPPPPAAPPPAATL